MPRIKLCQKVKKQKKLIASKLMKISLRIDNYIYKHTTITESEAEILLKEVASYVGKCYEDVRCLQVIEKLIRHLKDIVQEQRELKQHAEIAAVNNKNGILAQEVKVNNILNMIGTKLKKKHNDRYYKDNDEGANSNKVINKTNNKLEENTVDTYNDSDKTDIDIAFNNANNTNNKITEHTTNKKINNGNSNKLEENPEDYCDSDKTDIDINKKNNIGNINIRNKENERKNTEIYGNSSYHIPIFNISEDEVQPDINDQIYSQSILDNFEYNKFDEKEITTAKATNIKYGEVLKGINAQLSINDAKISNISHTIVFSNQENLETKLNQLNTPAINSSLQELTTKPKISDINNVPKGPTRKKKNQKKDQENVAKKNKPNTKVRKTERVKNKTKPHIIKHNIISPINGNKPKNTYPNKIVKTNKITVNNNKVEKDISWIENIRYVREVARDEIYPGLFEDNFWDNCTLPNDWNNDDFLY